MTVEPTEEERRLMRLVADQGAQIARLTQTLTMRELIIKELRHEVKTERAAVVAYLRTRGGIARDLAEDIERGDHRREEEP